MAGVARPPRDTVKLVQGVSAEFGLRGHFVRRTKHWAWVIESLDIEYLVSGNVSSGHRTRANTQAYLRKIIR